MNGRVLLIEDEDDARELLARALRRDGFGCDAVADADAALAALAVGFYDVVVSDVVLGPRSRDGIELLQAMRQGGLSAPVVLITAFADVARLKAALNLGASYLLEKPFRAGELLEVLHGVLRREPDLSHGVERALARLGLTDKELVVARHLLKGLSSLEIAALEGNSERTIRQHITRVYAKCGVASRAEFFHHVLPL